MLDDCPLSDLDSNIIGLVGVIKLGEGFIRSMIRENLHIQRDQTTLDLIFFLNFWQICCPNKGPATISMKQG